METKFETLDGEKQQRILNAAMREFASKGYDRASTNRIVETACIAKGLLFHYFKNKKRLYLYLYDRGLRLITEEVFRGLDFSQRDFFARLTQAQRVKIDLIRRYPDIFGFLKAAYVEESDDVRKELDGHNQGLLTLSFQRVFEGVDMTVFREDLDPQMVLKTIAWAFEGFANSYLEQIRRMETLDQDYGELLRQTDEYTEFLKKCFYRRENK